MRIALALIAATVLTLTTGMAPAADMASAPSPVFAPVPVASDEWIVTLRATASVGPTFEGSDRFSFYGSPGVEFRRANEPARFSAPDDGFDYAVYETQTFRIGPVARYRSGRYFSDDRRKLFGLDDVRWTVEPGIFLEYWAAPWLRARAELRHGIRGYEGFVADLGLDAVNRFGAFTLAVGPRLRLGDSDYTDTLFGVTPGEAALNALVTNGRVRPFRADGGVTSVGAAASLSYQFSETWGAGVFANYRRLVGDAGDSPIARVIGSPNQFEVGASVTYSFRTRW